jgi:hypothetical protein
MFAEFHQVFATTYSLSSLDARAFIFGVRATGGEDRIQSTSFTFCHSRD